MQIHHLFIYVCNYIVERKDKTGHLKNIIVTANSNMPESTAGYSHHHSHLPKHPSQQTYIVNYKVNYNYSNPKTKNLLFFNLLYTSYISL